MRVYPQISVTATKHDTRLVGVKVIICKSGTTAVLVAFGHKLGQVLSTEYFSIPANTTYKFTAPKGNLFYMLFCKTASGTSTLDISAGNIDVELIA